MIKLGRINDLIVNKDKYYKKILMEIEHNIEILGRIEMIIMT